MSIGTAHTVDSRGRTAPLFIFLAFCFIGVGASECPPERDDSDFDGYVPPDDCDDTDGSIHPGAQEICNGRDDNCNGVTDEEPDEDGDNWSVCFDDCNDEDPDIHPYVEDHCDGVDNDCDNVVDEDCVYNDWDWDGIAAEDDCDDFDPTVSPSFVELCADLKDNNCNGDIDEDPCDEDEAKIRFYGAGLYWVRDDCGYPDCDYFLMFWTDIKIRNLTMDKSVWLELTGQDGYVGTYDGWYETSLDENYDIFGVDGDILTSSEPITYADSVRWSYVIWYRASSETYFDDNGGKGYPLWGAEAVMP